eukprot:10807567-Alexandrium_andersonii.AAC.1
MPRCRHHACCLGALRAASAPPSSRPPGHPGALGLRPSGSPPPSAGGGGAPRDGSARGRAPPH